MKIFTVLMLALTTMPLNVFALRGDTDCKGSVNRTAFSVWGGMKMESGFESFYSDFEKQVYTDTASLKKFQKKWADAINDESLLDGWQYTRPLNCGEKQVCFYKCNSYEATCKTGQKLKDCNADVYKCMVGQKIEEEYKSYMVNKICSGSLTTSAADKQAIQQERDFQKSGMVATAQENAPALTAGDKSAYQEYDPVAASEQNKADKERQKANAEYAEQLRNSDNWENPEEHEAETPTSTNNVATAQENKLTTVTNSAPVYAEEEPEIVQGEVMTLPKEYETNSSRGNAVASGSPRANINSIVASDVEKQAQESNNQSSISSANHGLTVSGGPTTKTTQKSAQDTHCPNGTKYDTNQKDCIYEKQPISPLTNNCSVYSFSYYTSLSGDLLKEQDEYFTQWQNACKNLASCKNAKEMTWKKDGKRGLKASDQADIYYCDPKTCLDGSQPKDYTCPEKNQNIENAKTGECKDSYFGVGKYDKNGKCKIEKCSDEKNYTLNTTKNKCELKTTANIREKSEAKKEAKAQSAAEKKYESDINELIDAYNTVMKKFVSECTSDGKTFKKTGCEG